MSGYLAAPHMLRFGCLGSECEDTCCSAWEVPISENDIARLASGIGQADAEAMVNRIPDGKGGIRLALKRLDNGACTKLDPQQLCSVHAAHGEDVLPSICRSYPRFAGRVGDQLELTGRLSCPEVARLALLGDEATLAPAPPEALDRVPVRLDLTPSEDAPYLAPFREVRDAMIEVCMTPGFPVASRLYFIARIADKIGDFYHRGIEKLDRELLSHALATVKRPEVQATLHAQRGTSSPMEGLALQLAVRLVHSRLGSSRVFDRIARNAVRTHAETAGVPEHDDLVRQLAEIGPEQIWGIHQERRLALGEERTARLDDLLARYCRSYWLQDWYPLSSNLMEHAMLLILRFTLIRFLLVGQPDIRGDADPATLDKAAIDVFYAVARVLDHQGSAREVLAKMLQSRGMLTAAHAAALLKL